MLRLRTYLPEDSAKRLAARALDEGIDLALRAAATRGEHLTASDVAAMLGIDESYLRRMRDGDKPCPWHRRAQLRADVRRAVDDAMDRLLLELDAHAETARPSDVAVVSRLGRSGSELVTEICEALGDDGLLCTRWGVA